MSTPVKFGILGAGRIARNAFLPAINAACNAELVAVASRVRERAEGFGEARAYEGYDVLLEDDSVEAVYIATHNGLHHSLAIKALQCGKHVLSEKPLACTAAECREMIDVARACDRLLIEGFMYRYHPQLAVVQQLLQRIGPIKSIEASFSYHLRSDDDVRLNQEWGGGGLLDVGSYCVNICRLFFKSNPRAVVAMGTFHPEHGVDMALHGIMDFGDDRFGVVSCGFNGGLKRRCLICGTDGTITLPRAFFRQLEPLQVILNEGLNADVVDVPAADVFRLEIEDMSRAIRGGSPPQPESRGCLRQHDRARGLAAVCAGPWRLPTRWCVKRPPASCRGPSALRSLDTLFSPEDRSI